MSTEQGKQFAESRGIAFLETSAKASTNVEQAFLTLATEIKSRMTSSVTDGTRSSVTLNKGNKRKEIPESYFFCC